MIFTVTLAGATGQTVTVAYATVDNTATAGSDYTSHLGDPHLYPSECQPDHQRPHRGRSGGRDPPRLSRFI